jgi:hypothetical protein
MRWAVEQQAKTGLGALHWLRVAGPFATQAEAEAAMARRQLRIDAPMRVTSIGVVA